MAQQRLPALPEGGTCGTSTVTRSRRPLRKDTGQERLEELGYHQELQRKFSKLTSCCSGFALMSFLLGLIGSLPTVWVYGGPVVAVWGFVMVAACSFLVALSLAELASCYPLAGGPYFWCLELTDNNPDYHLYAFSTGYLNLLGQVANLGCSAYITTDCISFMVQETNGHHFSFLESLLTYAVLLLIFGLAASMPTKLLRVYTAFSGMFLLSGGTLFMIVMLALAPAYRKPTWVFTAFRSGDAEANGISNWGYIWILGVVSNAFSFIGMESPVQFAEMTRRADKNVPYGIITSVILETGMGLAFILAFLFCIPEDDALLRQGMDNSHFVQTIFISIIKDRLGKPAIGVALLGILLVAIFNSTVLTVAVNARMLWSFSREGGVFLYRVWAAVDRRLGVPLNATLAMTTLAFFIGLPLMYNTQTLYALGAISSVGLNLSYVAPIVLRMWKGRKFTPGPYSMGHAQPWVNVGALIYILVSTVAFCLPDDIPVAISTFNWTPVMLGIIFGAVLLVWYMPRFGARYWYHGKAHLLPDTGIRGGGRYQDGEANYGRTTIPLTDLIAEVMSKHEAAGGRRSRPAQGGAFPQANSRSSYQDSLRNMRLVERQV